MSKRSSARASKTSGRPARTGTPSRAAGKGKTPSAGAKRAKPTPLAKAKHAHAAGGHGPAADARPIEIIARGVLLHGSRVLLCRNVKHGYLYLPGGHVEFGESAAAALAREFMEESGLRVTVGDLLMVDEGRFETGKRAHHEINLTFHVELAGGPTPKVVRSREDNLELPWIELAAIVDLDVRPVAAKAFLLGDRLAAGGRGGVEWVSVME